MDGCKHRQAIVLSYPQPVGCRCATDLSLYVIEFADQFERKR